MSNTAIIIPALNPEERLIEYCDDLIVRHGGPILVVDDGSDDDHQFIFDALAKLDGIVVMHHPVNFGKGRALKNSFTQVLQWTGQTTDGFQVSDGVTIDAGDMTEEQIALLFAGINGVITADSDGQHSVKDVIALSEEIKKNDGKLVMGARDFDSDNVPPKSKTGNKLTRALFNLLYRVKLTDTQTGLRGIPLALIPTYLRCKGDRFEYELDMLIVSSREKIGITEILIDTIYENQNAGTHFKVIADSCAIYRVLLGSFLLYMVTSLSSFLIDIIVFQIGLFVLIALPENTRIYAATVVARIISSIYNYLMNKNFVFGKKGDGVKTAVGYYILVVVQMMASASLVVLLHKLMPIPEAAIKIIVDTVLFVASFQIQKQIIFKNKE